MVTPSAFDGHQQSEQLIVVHCGLLYQQDVTWRWIPIRCNLWRHGIPFSRTNRMQSTAGMRPSALAANSKFSNIINDVIVLRTMKTDFVLTERSQLSQPVSQHGRLHIQVELSLLDRPPQLFHNIPSHKRFRHAEELEMNMVIKSRFHETICRVYC